jgi:hypothetical protein
VGPLPAWRTDLEVRQRDDGSVDVPRSAAAPSVQLGQSRLDDRPALRRHPGRGPPSPPASPLRAFGSRRPASLKSPWITPRSTCWTPPRLGGPNPPRTTTHRGPSWRPAVGPLKVLPQAQPEARWSCHRCGECCHGLAVELSAAEEARIDRSLYRDVLGDRPFVERAFIDPDSPAKRVLRHKPGPPGSLHLFG